MREIRFSIDRDWAGAAHGEEGFAGAHPVSNSWGGWPSAVGIAPYLTLRAYVDGPPDPAMTPVRSWLTSAGVSPASAMAWSMAIYA